MTRYSRRQWIPAAAGTAAIAARCAAAVPLPAARELTLGVIGTGRRGNGLLRALYKVPGMRVTALCDLDRSAIQRALDTIQTAGGAKPAVYSAGPEDYRNLLSRADVEGVLIATPNHLHAAMAVDSMRAGKKVLSEVPGAVTLEDCWRLVKTAEETKAFYMLAENVCYLRHCLMIREIVRKGLLGRLTYAECGYVHDTRRLQFNADGSLNWRAERAMLPGNRYPTHGIGPVAQCMDINRGDRFTSLVALASPSWGFTEHLAGRFGADSKPARTKFGGDTTVCLIQTALGRLIELRYDALSPRPHPSTTYHNLQGSRGSYKNEEGQQTIWIEGRTKEFAWEPLERYAAEFESPVWRQWGTTALTAGHSGGDFMTLLDFADAVRGGRPSPIDAYDSAAWSAIIALSEASVRSGGHPQEFPDFTRGAWERRTN